MQMIRACTYYSMCCGWALLLEKICNALLQTIQYSSSSIQIGPLHISLGFLLNSQALMHAATACMEGLGKSRSWYQWYEDLVICQESVKWHSRWSAAAAAAWCFSSTAISQRTYVALTPFFVAWPKEKQDDGPFSSPLGKIDDRCGHLREIRHDLSTWDLKKVQAELLWTPMGVSEMFCFLLTFKITSRSCTVKTDF